MRQSFTKRLYISLLLVICIPALLFGQHACDAEVCNGPALRDGDNLIYCGLISEDLSCQRFSEHDAVGFHERGPGIPLHKIVGKYVEEC